MKFAESTEGAVLVFELSGYLKGRPEGYEFLEVVRGRIGGGTKKIAVDLGGVDRIDSSGIGVIASIITSAENGGAVLCFCNVKGRVRELLEMVGITRVIDCAECRDDAISGMND